uniref:WD repeat-containing protein 74 n=2 Tax=Schistocephalus solidus TaxID=70667 RepID=A0A0V0J364_SCHSO
MELGDVVTVSPIGIAKAFNFCNPKLIDCALGLECNELVCWDPFHELCLYTASKTKIQKVSLIDGSVDQIPNSEYQFDASDPVGLAADNNLLVIGKKSGLISTISLQDFNIKTRMQVPKNLVVCKYYNSLILSGGKETVFSVWDVTNPAKALFTAKNVRPDTLDLRVPVWLSDASFVEGYEDSLFLTASKYGDFSLYDTRTGQRRPVSRSAWRMSRKQGKLSVGSGHSPAVLRDLAVTRPITRVVAFSSGPGVGVRAVAGNAIGDICLLDFRVPRFCLTTSDGDTDTGLSPPLKRRGRSIGNRAPVPPAAVKTFVPASGAVSGLVCGGGGCANLPHASPTCSINDQPIVLSSSLDRFFRVYHRDSGELLSKIFVKTPVSTFLVRKSAQFPLPAGRRKPKKAEKEEENEVQDDYNEETDAIWDKMEPVILKSIPPKRTSDKSDDHLAPREKKKRAPM